MKVDMKIEMGSEVKDVLTGYRGICSAYTFHLTGCDVIAIKSRELDKDGKVRDPFWVDVTRVEVLAPPAPEIAKVIERGSKESEGDKPGGPQDCSQRSSDI